MQLSEVEAHRRTAATRSGEISYIDIGAGPVALFAHGIATNAYLWRHVIEALAGQRRCIAVDLPLHGRSPVTAEQDLSLPALAAGLDDFCEALGLTGIDLVANDTGGAIAQVFAARYPQRLATLTLTNCDTAGNLPPDAFKPLVELAAAGNLAPSAVAMLGDLEAAAQVSFASGYENLDRIDRDVIRSYLEPCFGTMERARQFERLLVALDDGDLQAVTPQLRELTVPTLMVWGTGDAFFDVSWAYWLRDTIPGTTGVVTVDGARLFFPEERPMDLVPHLEQHWAAVAAARA
ncbi:MAG TPA: alpha/beta hydrolase [Streptosporangiaceae bacterium]|nr:alpha/beta hydrolase [Streptosporangiaceae bacterium]